MDPKDKFVNISGGVAGAVVLDHEGKAKGVPVFPGEAVWLSEQEQVLTANAPRNEEDNPFANGTFRLEVKADSVVHARPIGRTQDPSPEPPAPPEPAGSPEEIDLREEQGAASSPPPPPNAEQTGAAPAPEGEPPLGQPVADEEVAASDPEDAAVEQPAAPSAPEEQRPKPAPKPL